MSIRKASLWALALALTLSTVGWGCNSGKNTSSSTHWLRCESLDDCPMAAGAVACNEGYCVDTTGSRISADDQANGGAGGDTTQGTGEAGSNAATSAGAMPGAAGDTTLDAGSAGSNPTMASAGAMPSAAGDASSAGSDGTIAAAGAGGTAADAGTAGDGGTLANTAGAAGAAGATTMAGSAGAGGEVCVFGDAYKACASDDDCTLAQRVSDCCGTIAITGVSTSELSAFSEQATACNATWPPCGCASQGSFADDNNQATDFFTGQENPVGVACTDNLCQSFVEGRVCGELLCEVDQLCVLYTTAVLPGSEEYACEDNPCGDALACDCAQSLCDARTDAQRLCLIGARDVDVLCEDQSQ